MFYKSGEIIRFAAFFSASGLAKTGLSVSAKVMRLGTESFSNCDVHEDGLGFYSCTFAAHEDGFYVCRFDVDAEDVEQKQIAAAAWYGLGISRNTAFTLPATFDMSDDEFTILLDNCARKKMEFFCGDSFRMEITVIDACRTPVDLSSCEAIFGAKCDIDDSEFVIQKLLLPSAPTDGKILLELTAAETKLSARNYMGEIELRFASGEIRTLWQGIFAVKKGLI